MVLSHINNDFLLLLTEIILPDQLEEIGEIAFCGCKQLRGLELPSTLQTISARSFGNCKSIKEINFPENLKKLDLTCIEGCSNTIKLHFPSNNRLRVNFFKLIHTNTEEIKENLKRIEVGDEVIISDLQVKCKKFFFENGYDEVYMKIGTISVEDRQKALHLQYGGYNGKFQMVVSRIKYVGKEKDIPEVYIMVNV